MTAVASRECTWCGESRATDAFYRNRPECKSCTIRRQRECRIARGWRPAQSNASRGEENLAKARAALAAKHPPVPAETRFWRHVEKTDGCWLWKSSVNSFGYGYFMVKPPRPAAAHRWSWEHHNGPIPDGLYVLHRCDVPACVNPEHLFLGTRADNNHDMHAKGRDANQFTKRAAFPCGHPYAAPHLRTNKNGHRRCHTCKMERQRQRRSA